MPLWNDKYAKYEFISSYAKARMTAIRKITSWRRL
jgi:hypothetical protein